MVFEASVPLIFHYSVYFEHIQIEHVELRRMKSIAEVARFVERIYLEKIRLMD
jgi:hypothetical protein